MYWLEKRMLERGLSEETIIARMQIHQKTWKRWVKGSVWFKSPKHAEKLCHLLRTTLKELRIHWGERTLEELTTHAEHIPLSNMQPIMTCQNISGPTLFHKEIEHFLSNGGQITVYSEEASKHDEFLKLLSLL